MRLTTAADGLYVLGAPFPGDAPQYRGLGRRLPSYHDDLPAEHDANAAWLESVAAAEGGVPIASIALARRLVKVLTALPGESPLEIVEGTSRFGRPTYGTLRYGIDIILDEGVSSLLVDGGFVRVDRSSVGKAKTEDLPLEVADEVRSLREWVQGVFNSNLLFEDLTHARDFVGRVTGLDNRSPGIWEGPGSRWVPIELWSVPGTRSSRDAISAQ